jgi:hypothetical protein
MILVGNLIALGKPAEAGFLDCRDVTKNVRLDETITPGRVEPL